MGFGILLFGYFVVLGTLPSALLFGNFLIIVAFGTSVILVCALKLLSGYNVYFRIAFAVSIVFSALLLASIPFETRDFGDQVNIVYSVISRTARYIILLALHNFLLQAIRTLARSIGNKKIAKKARRNLVVTYIYFIFTVFAFFDAPGDIIAIAAVVFGILLFALNFALFYSCYMRITYEGHDEEVERKYNEREEKRKRGK